MAKTANFSARTIISLVVTPKPGIVFADITEQHRTRRDAPRGCPHAPHRTAAPVGHRGRFSCPTAQCPHNRNSCTWDSENRPHVPPFTYINTAKTTPRCRHRRVVYVFKSRSIFRKVSARSSSFSCSSFRRVSFISCGLTTCTLKNSTGVMPK